MNHAWNSPERSSWDIYGIPNQELFAQYRAIPYTESGNPYQTLYLSIPKKEKNPPLILFFHGGGLTSGGRTCPDAPYCGNYAVAEIRYRLSPQTLPPGQIEDAAAAVAFLFEHAGEYRYDRSRLIVCGQSAGAWLAAMAVWNQEYLARYGLNRRNIAAMVLISGQLTTHFRVKADLGRDLGRYIPQIDEYAPLRYLAADLPPLLLITGDPQYEIPGRVEENALAAASLKALGHTDVQHFSLGGFAHTPVLSGCNHLILVFLEKLFRNPRFGNTDAEKYHAPYL